MVTKIRPATKADLQRAKKAVEQLLRVARDGLAGARRVTRPGVRARHRTYAALPIVTVSPVALAIARDLVTHR
jgi:hypothetical protein